MATTISKSSLSVHGQAVAYVEAGARIDRA
jgi:hypothetical protein